MGWHCTNCGHYIVDKWDTCTYCGASRYGRNRSDRRQGRTVRYDTYIKSRPNAKVDIELLIKAVILAIAVMVLLKLGLINYGSISSPTSIFLSLTFFLDFIFIFITTAIYDYLVAKHVLTYQALFGSIILSLLLSTSIIINQTNGFLLNLIVVILAFLAGFVIGKGLHGKAYSSGKLKLVNGSITFLIILWIVYLAVNLEGTSITNVTSNFSSFGVNFLRSFNNTTSSSSYTDNTAYLSQSVLNSCLSKVNSVLQIADAKLPSGTSVTIINSTVFYYNLTANNTINNINSWITTWNSGYSFGGGESCKSDYADLYVCKDWTSLSYEIRNTKNLSDNSIIGEGVAIKFDFPPQSQSNGFTEVSPVLCDPTGALMSSSYNYLKGKTSYN